MGVTWFRKLDGNLPADWLLKKNKLAFHQSLATRHSGMLIGKLSNACSLLCLPSGISVASGVSMAIDLTTFYVSSFNCQLSCHRLSLTPLSFARMRYNSQSIRQALICRCFVKNMVKLLLGDTLKLVICVKRGCRSLFYMDRAFAERLPVAFL